MRASILLLFSGLLFACGPAAAPTTAPPAPRLLQAAPSRDLAPGQAEVSMEIIELMCRPCAAQIVSGSRELPGVRSVTMELATKTLTLRFDTGLTDQDQVIAAVEQIVANIQ